MIIIAKIVQIDTWKNYLLKIDKAELVERVKNFMVHVASFESERENEILEEIKLFILENVTINVNYQIWMSKEYLMYKTTNLIDNIKKNSILLTYVNYFSF
ncbi:hypothetical protein [Spiroplasma floricola]|uniref:Uncharacterized protein n=1 Tax=Spiroplasma floricola 23-6 TaxID=1336749 RepID=A0A2K8SE58_9MOLU|nr:hypothetical protein [Spiroplasma floricola]AUB31747.1 hypothetical protein SFLOR_v1c06990 [Spiroplasma floricola 23-6]